MNGFDFTLAGIQLTALGSGALWWPLRRLLCVSDLHLGKSERILRKGGTALPPYENHDTLIRLEHDLQQTGAASVICLGDSFDDLEVENGLSETDRLWLTRLQAGRRWVWIEGNHDPGPMDIGGSHLAELPLPPLCFRHIAVPGQSGEISGHYHPKARIRTRLRSISRPAFLVDDSRVIMPAYGTYTGGLNATEPVLQALMRPTAIAILTGPTARAVSMPRAV